MAEPITREWLEETIKLGEECIQNTIEHIKTMLTDPIARASHEELLKASGCTTTDPVQEGFKSLIEIAMAHGEVSAKLEEMKKQEQNNG